MVILHFSPIFSKLFCSICILFVHVKRSTKIIQIASCCKTSFRTCRVENSNQTEPTAVESHPSVVSDCTVALANKSGIKRAYSRLCALRLFYIFIEHILPYNQHRCRQRRHTCRFPIRSTALQHFCAKFPLALEALAQRIAFKMDFNQAPYFAQQKP